MELRANRVKRKLQARQPVLVLSEGNLDVIESLGPLGIIDGVKVDMEHGAVSWQDLRDFSRACDLWGLTSIVRVERGDPWIVGKALDQGVQGVIVPHVNTKAAAEQVVQGAKYSPQGMRGMASHRQTFGVKDYYLRANDDILVMVMIEEARAVADLVEILKVEHIDCFIVAPSDLAQSMGPRYVGNLHHPDVSALRDQAMRAIVAAGRSVGTHLEGDDQLEHFLDLGALYFWTSPHRYVRSGVRGLRARMESFSAHRT